MNRKFTPALLCAAVLSCMAINGNAQAPAPCGTEPTPEQIEFLEQTRKLRQEYDPGFMKSVVNIPVQHHIARRSDGTGGLSASTITTLMNDLNTYYANANLSFSECNTINYIDDDTYFDFSTSEESAVCGANDVPKVINIYYFNTVTSGSSSYCGYTRLPPSTLDRIIVKNSCATNGSTVIHEVGHYLSLYHTHGKTNTGTTDELVDGSNCTTAGDDVCDTPADPNLSGKVNGSCQYTGTATDANGDSYNPDPSNIMSYSLKACRNTLSSGQYSRVAYSAVNDRGYLLCDTTPPPPCNVTVSNFPYSESFESGIGQWSHSNNDDINWIRDGFGTPSSSTGPSSASDGSYYIYTESSGYYSKKAYLESPCFDITSLSNPELSFYYNMYGATMGTLQVDISTDGGQTWNNAVWSKSGNQGTSWHLAQIDLSAYSGNEVRIRLHGTTGTSFTSDMAVDDIQVGEHRICPRAVVNFPDHETFYYNSIGDWEQSADDDIDWTANYGSTPSAGTGPNSGADGSYYVYVEASGNSNKKAILESPCYDLSNTALPELSFQFHMYGNDMGSLAVQVSEDGGDTWSGNIWYVSGNQGPDLPDISRFEKPIGPFAPLAFDISAQPWMQATIPVGDFASAATKFRFVAVTGPGYTSDIALDDIWVRTSECNSVVEAYPYNENFEADLGDWVQETNDDAEWTFNSGATPTPGTGPDAASIGNGYVYVEASGGNSPGKEAGLVSPCFNLFPDYPYSEIITIRPIDLMISFDYHMTGADMGTLKVQISRDGGNTWEDKWVRDGANFSDSWFKGYVYLGSYGYSTIRVRFLAITGDGALSDIAIDNFTIVPEYRIIVYNDGVNEGEKDMNALEVQKELSMEVFPNPSSNGAITVRMDGGIPEGTFEVYDATARQVWSNQVSANENNALRLDLNHLKGGYYILQFKSEDGSTLKPVRFILLD